ncbi:helix-turn-helix domain-containing protein [Haloimpatiens lingqiaonensis]|uniref:helix-turn-helix domain-containing protein n=1 Tax=Haloimpatiens lingqiaonensis TaxID=1380675 RepID=UPI0010FF0DD6|nr:helix-turn-helix domain-containing protein [Haloimpatiens lingqiaonensis]
MQVKTKLDNVYTPKEVAPMLRIHVNSVYELVATGELRSIRVGRKILISETAIGEFINGAN